jgi:hypothetical protein
MCVRLTAVRRMRGSFLVSGCWGSPDESGLRLLQVTPYAMIATLADDDFFVSLLPLAGVCSAAAE